MTPPPFGSFPKKHPFWRIQSPLRSIDENAGVTFKSDSKNHELETGWMNFTALSVWAHAGQAQWSPQSASHCTTPQSVEVPPNTIKVQSLWLYHQRLRVAILRVILVLKCVGTRCTEQNSEMKCMKP